MIIELNTQLRAALQDTFGYKNVKVLLQEEVQDISNAFGSPIFMPLTLESVSYETSSAAGNKIKAKVPEMILNCCMVEISFQKEIIKTTVQAQRRTGTFKEYINMGDFVVNIKGILSDDSDKYPYSLVQQLNEFINAPVSIAVQHPILDKLGIFNLVIEGGGLVPKQGYQNLQPFQLNCVSDLPLQLKLKNEAEAKKA